MMSATLREVPLEGEGGREDCGLEVEDEREECDEARGVRRM